HVFSPLGASLIVHALLLAVFGGISWAVARTTPRKEIEFEAKIIAEGPTSGSVGRFRFPGRAALDRPDAGAADMNMPRPTNLAGLLDDSRGLAIPRPVGLDVLTRQDESAALSREDIIGTGGGGALGRAGAADAFGDRDVAGGGPIGSLWGVGEGQRGETVVYVVDRSGSMSDIFPAIDLELKRSIGILRDDQRFNVIFLRDNKPLAFRTGVVAGSLANKRHVFAWINLYTPSLGSDLAPAVRVALGYKPDILFIITDDFFLFDAERSTSADELTDVISAARRRKRTTVNAILVQDAPRPRDAPNQIDPARFLRTLTSDTGGSLSIFSSDELIKRYRKSRAGG
ncbi:MAG: hypothetical protein V3T70_01405, partial [Phycisphaerae bacterium]